MPYYDRNTDGPTSVVLCDPCGAAAWPGWPLTLHRPADGAAPARTRVLTGEAAAFERRYSDPAGEFCWTPFYGTAPYIPGESYPCAGCGAPADGPRR